MTAALLAIGAMLAYGIPATLMFDPAARRAKLTGLAFLYGSGIVFLSMLALSFAHATWSVPRIAFVAFALAAGTRLLRRTPSPLAPRPSPLPLSPSPLEHDQNHLITLAAHLVTTLTISAYAFYSTLAPLWEWDFWAIWGLKARVFFLARGIDWRFLESRWNAFSHPDYPLLVPLNDAFVALIGGGWNDRYLGLLNVAFAAALLCVVYAVARRETTPLIAATTTLACAAIACSRYVGLAEGALIAFGGAGVSMLRGALHDDDPVAFRHAALLLGFAASCKNEGLALLVAAIISVAIVARERVVRLWPSIAIVTPWLILRALHRLPTDLAEGNVASRVIAHLGQIGAIARHLATSFVTPLLWIGLIAAIAILPPAWRRRERFVLLVVGIQLAFYIGSYLSTPHDVHWHIETSWPRLTRHLLVPLIVAIVPSLANLASRGEDAAHAEARPDL